VDPVHDPPVLEHVTYVEGKQLGNAETRLDAQHEQSAVPECIPAAEAVAHLKNFRVSERASAFHQSAK
jgi:hypothetical protein